MTYIKRDKLLYGTTCGMVMPELDLSSNLGGLPDPEEKYICWFDIMGTTAISSRSITEAAIKVFKLHVAAISALNSLNQWEERQINLYPMMDGVYGVSSRKGPLLNLLRSVFQALGEDIVEAEELHHVLVVKAAIAYGPIIQGAEIEGYDDRIEGTPHQERTMIGLPIVQAFLSENEAPPFGIYVHESARAFAPEGDRPFNFVWWKWFRAGDEELRHVELAQEVREKLEEYYDWCRENSNRIDYEIDRIEAHEDLMQQYYPEPEHDTEQTQLN